MASSPALATPYDAVLLTSFGGPQGPDEVMPFLRHVTGGRGVPEERLAEVAEHYFARGGVSPISAQNEALRKALDAELTGRGADVPVVLGNRHAAPFLTEALGELADAGVERAAAVITSAYPSYSGCRQYLDAIAAARTELNGAGRHAPEVDRIRMYARQPAFTGFFADRIVERLATTDDGPSTALVFVTHSIPVAMNASAGPDGGAYEDWHRAVIADVLATTARRLGVEEASLPPADLAFCSRSGPPQVPWLEPDVNDHLRKLADGGVGRVVLIPIGFVSDHMEVVHDLDTEAAATAAELGLDVARVPTPGTDPEVVSMLADLVLDRAREARGDPALHDGIRDTGWSICPPGCCPAPVRRGTA